MGQESLGAASALVTSIKSGDPLDAVLVNAIKYTPPRGRIKIRVEQTAQEVWIEISDNGIGIAPEILPTICDLFTQANPTIDRSHGGLGIGLSIVKRLVQMHSGTFSAASEGVGRGAQFTLRFPLMEPPHIDAPQSVAQKSGGYRLLIVDDNVDAADSLAQLLTCLGHEALAVHSANDGLQYQETVKPEVALLDIGLPDMTGYELARRFRIAAPRVKLIALTGYGTAEDRQQSERAGFDFHLTKPVAIAELEQVIAFLCTAP